MRSAYSETLRRILAFLKNPEGDIKNSPPFNMMKDRNILESVEINGIKMGFTDVDKTLNFVKNFTLEPPMTFYAKGIVGTLDYIFYSGDIAPIRILNIPDVNKIVFDVGYLPADAFPSDHISLCTDFYILS
jgi:mRNA deadenylase 3'-5' endonuclease subunit Ccr4